MIILVRQTEANVDQAFDIWFDGENFCSGELGSLHRTQNVSLLKNGESVLTGKFKLSHWENYVPFRNLFGTPNFSRALHIEKNDKTVGGFVFSRHGFFKSCYLITLSDNTVFYCYIRAKGSFEYVSVYKDERQIALLETYLTVVDMKYSYKMYLLDEFTEHKDVFALFILYYANYHFTHRFHMSSGTMYGKSWSVSRYNGKYDPEWRPTHFPNENFWGKINRFD